MLSDLASPASWVAVTDIGKQFSGVVFGIQNSMGAVGAALCPLLVPAVANIWSWELVLPVFGTIFLACAASWLLVDVSKPLPEPSADPANASPGP